MPFSLEPLKKLLATERRCLDNNFVSGFLTLVGSVVAFHYSSIIDIHEECPLVLCYSKGSGTGRLGAVITLYQPKPIGIYT